MARLPKPIEQTVGKSIKRKVRRRVRKQYGKGFERLGDQRQKLSRQRAKEISSVQGATAMGLDAVQGALQRIPGGLGGRIENQLTNELQAMRGDVRMGGRQQVIAANQAYRTGLQDVHAQTQTLRDDQRDAVHSAIADVAQSKIDRRVDRQEIGDEQKLATREATQLLTTIRKTDPTAVTEGATWQWVEDQLSGMEGISPETARQVVHDMHKRLKPWIGVGQAATEVFPGGTHPSVGVGRAASNFFGR